MTIGEKLRWARERQGMQAQVLAGMVHVTPQCVCNWEKGLRRIPCEFLPHLSDCLGCPELMEYRLRECPVMAARAKKVA